MSFRILHISDIHFGPRCRHKLTEYRTLQIAGETAANDLQQDLVRNGYKSDFHAVVVSGDLTWENKHEEFTAAAHFLKHLSSILEVPFANIVVIPGNHDIAWSEADPLTARRFYSLHGRSAESGYRQFYTEKLNRELSGYLVDMRIFQKDKIIIVGLNSCRLVNKRDAGLGYVGREQVEQAIRDLRAAPAYRTSPHDFFKIAVLHHHMLPMCDLSLTDIEKAPADRKFSITIDAKRVLDLLLSDNFSLILHGHQHLPFCAVERRLPITSNDPAAPGESQIAVAAAGSLFVDPPHATHNQFQVIDLEEKTVKIAGVELHWDEPTGVKYKQFDVTLDRVSLTLPCTELSLRDEDEKLIDDDNNSVEDSRIWAENVYDEQRDKKRDPRGTRFIYANVEMQKKGSVQLSDLSEGEFRTRFDQAMQAWMGLANPLQSYEQDGAKALVPFPEYLLRLMVVIDARKRGTRETK